MFKGLKLVILTFLMLGIIPFILAWTIEFTNPIDASFVNRNYILVNVTSSAANTTNITIDLYDSSWLLNNTNSTSSEQSWLFTNFTDLSEGIYYINATATDNESNTENVTGNVTIDLTNPSIWYSEPTDNGTTVNRPYILINVTSDDTNLENVTIYIYNSSFDIINATQNTTSENYMSYYLNYSVPSNDTYYFNATVYDKAGNFNYTELWNVTVNTTMPNVEPNVSMNSPGNNSNSSQEYVILNVTVYDFNLDNLTVRFYGDDSPINTTLDRINGTEVTYNWTPSSDGLHNWTAIADDGTANSTYEYYYFTIDSTAPTITVHTPSSSGTTIYYNNLTFNITANDDRLKNITLRVYNSIWVLINSTTNITNNTQSTIYKVLSNRADDTYYYNITAYDTFGNFNISNGNITINTNAPSITLHNPKDIMYTNSSMLLNFSISSASNFTCYYILNEQNNSITNCTAAYTTYFNTTTTINTFTLYVDAYSGLSSNETARFMVGDSSNTLESNNPIVNINSTNSNYTNIFVPSNISLTQVRVESNTSGNETIRVYFINISSNTAQSTLYLSNALNVTRNSTTARYVVEFPNNLTIFGPSNWTGELGLPTNVPGSSVSITPTSGMTVSVSKAISIGYSSRLNLSKSVKINFTGESGKIIGYDEGSGTIVRISNTCPSANNQTQIDLNFTGQYTECIISSGNDSIVWTKHLSRYVTFTEATTDSGDNGDDDGGGRHSSGSSTSGEYLYVPNVTVSNDTDKVTLTEYISRQYNGSRVINVNKPGMPLTYLSLWINVSENKSNTIDITSQSNNPSNQDIDAKIYRYILLNTSLNPGYIHDVTIKFKLSKSWISLNNLTADNITLYYFDEGWKSTNTSRYSEDTGYIYYSSNIIGLKSFAIGGQIAYRPISAEKNKTETNPNVTKEVLDLGNESEANNVEVKEESRGFFSNAGVTLRHFFKGVSDYVSELKLIKNKQSLVIFAISCILTVMLGVIAVIIVYKNHKIDKKEEEIIVNKAPVRKVSKSSYEEEPPTKETIITTTVEKKAPEIQPLQNTEMYLKKINQLLTQCEYSLDNGKPEEAKKYYDEAKSIYFKANMSYEHKVKVYDKIIELHGKINR
jgi:PGF-pre-PGF domain-containing protein